ncbi:MAG TPA: L,D-transpeptidase family protein [Longimicrobiaceae bacterium]|nr:L,D-transpeptidase family protein [Longimicrobiaceae bacterium]
MRRILLPAALALAALLGAHPDAVPAAQSVRRAAPLDGTRQLLLVTTAGWDSVPGTLRRYERAYPGGAWRPVGAPVAVVVGRSGMGWGRGLHEVRPAAADPVKREGDGRAPAGAFRIGSAFGYASASAVRWIRLPYIRSSESHRCVDDVASAHYNRVVDSATVQKDWTGRVERMRLDDDQYKLGAIVEHNWGAQTRPGDGSCIFLHVWRGPRQGTAGCTAMAETAMAETLRWLDPALAPVLVQLPRAEYEARRLAWGLP